MAGTQQPHLADCSAGNQQPHVVPPAGTQTPDREARPTSAQMAKAWRPGSGGRGQRSHQVVLGGPGGLTQVLAQHAICPEMVPSGQRGEAEPWAFREVQRLGPLTYPACPSTSLTRPGWGTHLQGLDSTWARSLWTHLADTVPLPKPPRLPEPHAVSSGDTQSIVDRKLCPHP